MSVEEVGSFQIRFIAPDDISVRGRFRVTDLAAAKGLRLNVEYRGGIVVYTNGHEIARGHLPAKGIPEELAHDCPRETFFDARGKLIETDHGEKDPENLRRHQLEGAMMLGIAADTEPPTAVLKTMAQLFASVRWMRHAHSLRRSRPEFPLGYQAVVWSALWPGKPADGGRLGWSREDRVVQFMCSGEGIPLTLVRLLGEICRQALDEGLWATMIGVDDHKNSGLIEMEGHEWWSSPGQVGYHWYLGSDWQDRSQRLYELAADVAETLRRNPPNSARNEPRMDTNEHE